MHPIFRTLKMVVTAYRGPQADMLDTSSVTMRVWPNDLDTNMHVNNGRYLTIMDLGRLDMMIRSRTLGLMVKRKWFPVLGAATVRFKRSLHLFEKFTLKTRILGWDEKWVYMEHRIETDKHLAVIAIVKALFRSKGRSIPSQELAEAFGHDGPSPTLPDFVEDWRKMEKDFDKGNKPDVTSAPPPRPDQAASQPD